MTTASQLYAELDHVKDAALNTLKEQIQRFGGKVDLWAIGVELTLTSRTSATAIDLTKVYYNSGSFLLDELDLRATIKLIADLEKHSTLPNPAQQFVAKVNGREPGTFPRY